MGQSIKKFFIEKYEMKMSGSSLQASVGWVSGIGECNTAQKQTILKGIIRNNPDLIEVNDRIIGYVIEEDAWAKKVLK
jgi:hypothetical protein